MRKFFLCAMFLVGWTAGAQTIIDDLQWQTHPSEGIISIESDPAITALIGKPASMGGALAFGDFMERTGFRIQVFMSSDPRTARSEATARQSAIRLAFPELPAYLLYEAPNWRLVVGDCAARAEADLIQQRLQKEFPQFGKEMYVVSDKIRVPGER